VKLELQEHGELEFVSCNETQNSGTKCTEFRKPNYPMAFGYWKLSRFSGARRRLRRRIWQYVEEADDANKFSALI
jgi:hypothetical protein